MKLFIKKVSFTALLIPSLLWGQPDFSRVINIEGVICYRDAHYDRIAYYSPGKLSIAVDRDGQPDFNFIQTRYTGSFAYGDQGARRFQSLVRFRVIMERYEPELLDRIRAVLWPGHIKGELRPLPVYSIKTLLLFTPILSTGKSDDSMLWTGGSFTAENEAGHVQKGVFWREREFSLRLDDLSSQALWNALEKDQTIMSLSYAFFSKGITTSAADITSSTIGLSQEIAGKLLELKDTTEIGNFCVRADAFSVEIDVDKWPGLLRKIDINEEIPPGYPVLEVRCYDFSNNLRPGLYSKTVEFKAQGVGRGVVLAKVRFDPNNPDLSRYNVQFGYAVKINQPLFYRITEISDSEMPVRSDWIALDSWHSLIDVTSSKDKIRAEENDIDM